MLKYSFVLLWLCSLSAWGQIFPDKDCTQPKSQIIYLDWEGDYQAIIIDNIGAWARYVGCMEATQPRGLSWSMVIQAPHNPLVIRNKSGKIVAQFNGANYKAADFLPVDKSGPSERIFALPIAPPLYIERQNKKLFYVYKGEKMGLVDSKGEIILDFKYRSLFQNNDNLYFCTAEGKTGLLDENYNVALPAEYNSISRLAPNSKLFVVSDYHTYGIIDERGQVVLPLEYLGGFSFHEGTAIVVHEVRDSLGRTRYARGIINTDGQFIVPCIFDDLKPLLKGNFAAAKRGDKWGLIDRRGQTVADFQYDYVGPFIDGLASVRHGDYPDVQFGFVDSTGREVIEPTTYRYLGYPSEGLCTACRDRDCGYVDLQGREVTPFHFSNVWDFKNGKAKVTYEQKTRYINRKGEFID